MLARALILFTLAATLAAQTSTVSGTIRNAYNQLPIPGVRIQLDDGDRPLETFTDAAGRYRFADIEQKAYNLRLEKDGYLFQPDYALPNQGTIVLEDKPLSLHYVMDQWTSLAGCVRDTDGKPVAEAAITLIPDGTPRSSPKVTTDAEGCYQFEQVFPGSYFVAARPTESNSPRPPTFYPSAALPSEAQRVPVTPGSSRRGIDIDLAQPRLGTIAGRVVDEEGNPLDDVQITLNPGQTGIANTPTPSAYMPVRFHPRSVLRATSTPAPLGEVRSTRSGPDGTFRFAGLVPGAWRLWITSNPRNGTISANQSVDLAPPTEAMPETEVELTARAMFAAELHFDWSGPPPLLTRQLELFSTGMDRPNPDNQPKTAPTSAHLPLAQPGPYSISALTASDTLPDGYYFAGLRQGGVDLQGRPAQLTRTAPPITIVLKPKAAQIAGQLEGDTAAIVLLWGNDIAREPVVRTTVAQPGESFRFGSLAPGTYHMAAFDRLPPDGLTVPFLQALTPSATTATLAEGATANPKLKTNRWLD